MDKDAKIYVAGHSGLLGSAIVGELECIGCSNILTVEHKNLDLVDQVCVAKFMCKERPKYVFLTAALVGGIKANMDRPAEFFFNNMQIEMNIIHLSYIVGVKKLLFVGSSCIYPKYCPQPIKEEYLLGSHLEETNEAYAIAKIAGIKMCQAYNKQYGTNFISVMPTNLYGPNDNYDENSSHVLPALIHKFHTAMKQNLTEVTLWGNGTAIREFMSSRDCAKACMFLMEKYDSNEVINVGSACRISIKNLAYKIAEMVGYVGKINFDKITPDGMPEKILDCSKINSLGWKSLINLDAGLKLAYKSYLGECHG